MGIFSFPFSHNCLLIVTEMSSLCFAILSVCFGFVLLLLKKELVGSVLERKACRSFFLTPYMLSQYINASWAFVAHCSASCNEMNFLCYLKQWPGINLPKLIFSVYIFGYIPKWFVFIISPTHLFFLFHRLKNGLPFYLKTKKKRLSNNWRF